MVQYRHASHAEPMTIPFSKLRRKWRDDPEYRKDYAALAPEFRLARELVEARTKAGLTQEQVAERMGTSQPTVARPESGHKPSLKTLERYAKAVGMKVDIRLVAG
ncbi:MAG TPA: helix-turn-helix transcriptional regulator [Alphaproteobacteria bacterium]|jgi:DNA-binding XRE family transcriptional regulator|nr:helix-turn-helix transcriptional regulator [Alphaproteobacteria bacterium]